MNTSGARYYILLMFEEINSLSTRPLEKSSNIVRQCLWKQLAPEEQKIYLEQK